jgi:hypothetical protein
MALHIDVVPNQLWALALAALAVLPAATPSPLAPALVDHVFADDGEVNYCFVHDGFRSRERFIRESYDIKPVNVRTGQRLVILRAHTACLCGTQNCPVSAYVRAGEHVQLALSVPAIDARFDKNGTAVILSHNSALTSFRETYVLHSTRYVRAKSEFVNTETGEAKPSEIRVRFAAGASSSELHGRVVLGFPDTYVVAAAKGQVLHVELNARNNDAQFSVTRDESSQGLASATRAWSGPLPVTGDYRIVVDGTTETAARYALKISIK